MLRKLWTARVGEWLFGSGVAAACLVPVAASPSVGGGLVKCISSHTEVCTNNSTGQHCITDSSTDPDRNGSFQEPLPAGTYTGVGANPFSIDYEGGIRGGRGPNYALLNMRAGWRFNLSENRYLQAHIDLFNVTNRANFSTIQQTPFNYTSTTGIFTQNTNFMAPTATYDPRILQIAARITF